MDIHIQVWQALVIALWVALVQSRILFGTATLTLRFSPMMTGLFTGIVLGNVPAAMMTTAAIQLIYMGVFAPGGAMPSEPCVATAIAVPVAILGGLEPTEAVAIAVPVGLLGSYLYQGRFFLNTFIVKLTDKNAANLNDGALFRSIIIYPFFAAALLYIPFMFIALYFGAPVIASFVQANSSGRFFHALSTIGGGLASIGIALTVYVIGKKNYIVFFLLAYFMSVILKSLSVTMVTYAIVGTIIAFLFVLVKRETIEKIGG